MELEDKKPVEKSLEYGYDGHRKLLPKTSIPPLNKRGNSTPKYLPPINQSEKNPLGVRQDYGNSNISRNIVRVSREKKPGNSDMNQSMITEDKRSYKSFHSGTRGKVNQSFTVDRTSKLDESSYQKTKDENITGDQSFLNNELTHDDSNLLGLGPSSKSKNKNNMILDSLQKDLPETDPRRSPSTDKIGKADRKVKITSFVENPMENEKQSNLSELWNNIQKYRNQNSAKQIGNIGSQSAKNSTKVIEKKELPQLIEMSPEKTMSDEQ